MPKRLQNEKMRETAAKIDMKIEQENGAKKIESEKIRTDTDALTGTDT